MWTWLIGAYVEAHYRIYGDREAALALMHPFENHLRDACLGSVSEILEGDPPHLPAARWLRRGAWPRCCVCGGSWTCERVPSRVERYNV